jgi:type I restriction enzyme S subunit
VPGPNLQGCDWPRDQQCIHPCKLDPGIPGTTGFDDVRFVLENLPRLTTRPAHIKQLRQTILNLAVRGKLVPQDPNDEPVSVLAKHVEILIRDDEPFSVPSSWHWVSVDQISKARLGKMLDKAKNKETPRRYLRNVNVRWFDFDLSDVYEMPFEDSELEEFMLLDGDVLICEGGEPGRAAVWDERETGIYFQKAIHRVRFPNSVNPHYFVKVIREAADSGRLQTYFTGVGIKHFTGKGLASFLIPLPPLTEQHRIVAKVDELMALCDQLETQLTSTAADSHRLLEAVLHEALSPASEQAA